MSEKTQPQVELEVEEAIGQLFGKLYTLSQLNPTAATSTIGAIVTSLNDMRLDIRINMLRMEILSKKPTPESGGPANTLN